MQINTRHVQRVDERSAYTGALEEEDDRVLQSLEQETSPARYVARWVRPRADSAPCALHHSSAGVFLKTWLSAWAAQKNQRELDITLVVSLHHFA